LSTRRVLGFLAKHLALFLTYGVTGAVLTLFAGALWLGVRKVPDLKPWHQAALREEFTRANAAGVTDLDTYRALEGRLFDALKHEVYSASPIPIGACSTATPPAVSPIPPPTKRMAAGRTNCLSTILGPGSC
jgi:hypothetical protein